MTTENGLEHSGFDRTTKRGTMVVCEFTFCHSSWNGDKINAFILSYQLPFQYNWCNWCSCSYNETSKVELGLIWIIQFGYELVGLRLSLFVVVGICTVCCLNKRQQVLKLCHHRVSRYWRSNSLCWTFLSISTGVMEELV